jgi:hypothetical protein
MVQPPSMFDEGRYQKWRVELDQCVMPAIVVTDFFDQLGVFFGVVVRRIEGADDRDRLWVREAIEFRVEPRAKQFSQWLPVNGGTTDPQSASERSLEHADDLFVCIDSTRAALESHSDVDSSRSSGYEIRGESTITKGVGHPIDASAGGDG